MSFYHGNEPGHTPGTFDSIYYWWEAGALFGLLIQRWSITGNSSLNDLVIQGMQFQVGPAQNYEPQNQTSDLVRLQNLINTVYTIGEGHTG
jgi:mannan endo-1,6-alpha-mannosidase